MQSPLLVRYAVAALTAVALMLSMPAHAEVCWDYTDFEPAKVPLKCVRMGNPALACSWNPTCNVDNDPSDCCMAVPDPGASQTIGAMHVAWHDCLGNVGTSANPPPPNRGLRWFAFHRQFESDFNVYRETLGLDKIDSLEWCPGMNMPYGHFGAGHAAGPAPLRYRQRRNASQPSQERLFGRLMPVPQPSGCAPGNRPAPKWP